jgi:flagellar FliJ protein
MSFKFPFETLARERTSRRNEAEREYRISQSKVYEQTQVLNEQKGLYNSAVEQLHSVRKGEGKLSSSLVALDDFISGQKVRIQNQIKMVKGLEEIAEQKRLVLVEAAKEVKVLEKLREKRYNEYKIKMRKREAKLLDEIAIMQTVRRD